MAASDIFKKAIKEPAFTKYDVTIQIHGKLIGGIPKDADTIKKWLQARIPEGNDLALKELYQETVEAMDPGTAFDDVIEKLVEKTEGGNGFKTNNGVLVYEGRCMKAALKESANIAYPGTDFPGKPKAIRKGLRNFMSETVFVTDDFISLGVSEPTGSEQRIKHIMTPAGPRSAINVVDFVVDPTLNFTLAVLDDCLPDELWGRLFQVSELNGLGSDRARGDGRAELVGWDRLLEAD